MNKSVVLIARHEWQWRAGFLQAQYPSKARGREPTDTAAAASLRGARGAIRTPDVGRSEARSGAGPPPAATMVHIQTEKQRTCNKTAQSSGGQVSPAPGSLAAQLSSGGDRRKHNFTERQQMALATPFTLFLSRSHAPRSVTSLPPDHRSLSPVSMNETSQQFWRFQLSPSNICSDFCQSEPLLISYESSVVACSLSSVTSRFSSSLFCN